MPILQRTIDIVRRAAGLGPDEPIRADTGLVGSGLWLDSVAVLEVIMAIEKEFGIQLDRTVLSREGTLATVGSLAGVVQSLVHGDP
jgi:acyl carrier protein